MGTKNYNNYSDMITFTRASSGTALAKISYGPELVTNGTFDTDLTGWTQAQGTIEHNASGALTCRGDLGTSTAHQLVTVEVGKVYEISWDLTSGTSVQIFFGTSSFGIQYGIYGYTDSRVNIVTTSSNLYLYFRGNTEAVTFDNISVKKVFFDQPDGTLQLFNHLTNQPRVEYDYQGNRLGLLVEEARTNLFTYSNDFTQWSNENSNDLADQSSGPDGNTSMAFFSEDSLTARHIIYVTLSGNLDVTRTLSVYLKKPSSNGRRYVVLSVPNTGDTLAYSAIYDLDTGSVSATKTNGTATIAFTDIQDVGGGVYRCILSGNSNSATSASFFPMIGLSDRSDFSGTLSNNNMPSYTGDGTSGVYIYGAQLEEGSFPTSYIPTAGSTVTRAADVASIGVGAFGYNAQGGTVVVTADWYPGSNFLVSNRAALEIGDGGVSERLLIYNHDGFAGRGFMKGVLFGDQTGSGARITDDQAKVALVFADANQAHCVDGGSIDTGSAAMLAGTTIMKIGPTLRTGHISSIAYYPRRLTDAQIKALTSPPETPTLSLTFDDSTTSYLETSIHG